MTEKESIAERINKWKYFETAAIALAIFLTIAGFLALAILMFNIPPGSDKGNSFVNSIVGNNEWYITLISIIGFFIMTEIVYIYDTTHRGRKDKISFKESLGRKILSMMIGAISILAWAGLGFTTLAIAKYTKETPGLLNTIGTITIIILTATGFTLLFTAFNHYIIAKKR